MNDQDILDDIEKSYLSVDSIRTHWDGCVTDHPKCAIAYLIKRVIAANAEVEKLQQFCDRLTRDSSK